MIDAKFYRNKETGAVVYGVAGNVEAADLELLQAGVTDGAAEKHRYRPRWRGCSPNARRALH